MKLIFKVFSGSIYVGKLHVTDHGHIFLAETGRMLGSTQAIEYVKSYQHLRFERIKSKQECK